MVKLSTRGGGELYFSQEVGNSPYATKLKDVYSDVLLTDLLLLDTLTLQIWERDWSPNLQIWERGGG
jgi:hypothetical protein